MGNNDLWCNNGVILRILRQENEKILVVNCNKISVPYWITSETLNDYLPYSAEDFNLPDISQVSANSRKTAYDRFNIIAELLPTVGDKQHRCALIDRISKEKGISKQTINKYLWLYLAYQNISALAPVEKIRSVKLTDDEKNFRWGLNKFYYTQSKLSLQTAYTLMLKEKYYSNGVLAENYPSFYKFRYYYRKHKDLRNFYISRNGIKAYQKDMRPLLGDGIQEFANTIGFGMLDATVCDIYLINDSGKIIGRPILTACVDAFTGLCCGYSLCWQGGIYSIKDLMGNIISDKVEHCKKFGIEITKEQWNFAKRLPHTFVTDKGCEYVSENFEQVTELGVKIINLPAYRPELKGAVEKFFDIIQGLFKPILKGKGIIEPDFNQRGAHDYRKDASLTIRDFETVILRCIVYYNFKKINENFPYTQEMIKDKIQPYNSDIWNYFYTKNKSLLIKTDYKTLMLTLLPRTVGKFSRKGLTVNKLRYKNEDYAEKFLQGGTEIVAYNPDNASSVYLLDNGNFVKFELIEKRFEDKSIEEILSEQRLKKNITEQCGKESLQAKIALFEDIEVISNIHAKTNGKIKGIRDIRQRESKVKHKDFLGELYDEI